MNSSTTNKQDDIRLFKKIAVDRGGKCLSDSYVNSKTKLQFICKAGHEWDAYSSNVKRGHWCKKCSAIEKAKTTKDSIELYKTLAIERGGKCLSENYINQNERLTFECEKGHQWSQRPVNIKRGDWCRICSYETISRKQKEFRKTFNKPFLDISILKNIATERGGKLLSDSYKNATTKLHWECEKGHQWWTTAQNIRSGTWCKKCSSKNGATSKTLTIEHCKKTATDRGGECLSEVYGNVFSKLKWQCKNGHVWYATYSNVRKGTWCRICSKKEAAYKRRDSIEYYKNYAIAKGGLCLSNTYENQTTKIKFQCAHGHIWETTAGSLKNGQTWCIRCAGTFKADTEELKSLRLNELIEIAKSKNGFCLTTTYVNNRTKMHFKCQAGHTWSTTAAVIKSGRWCKRCSSKEANAWKKDSIEVFKKIIEEKGGKCLTTEYSNQQTSRLLVECDKGHQWLAWPQHIKRGIWCRKCNGSAKLELSDIISVAKSRGGECLSSSYKNDMTKVTWKCSEGHIWDATPNNIKRGKWCPTCSSGIGERACRLFFEKIFQRPFNKVRPSWLKNKDGYSLELDGYNDELKIAFEHQGRQHYGQSYSLYSKENIEKNDLEKMELCKRHGVSLIYIPEVFTDIRVNDLLKYLLNELTTNKIDFPSKAKLIEVTPQELYTYTKTKEVEIREKRAIDIIKEKKAKLIEIYRVDSGVRIRICCAMGHTMSTSVSKILNGEICTKCSRTKKNSRQQNVYAMRGFGVGI